MFPEIHQKRITKFKTIVENFVSIIYNIDRVGHDHGPLLPNLLEPVCAWHLLADNLLSAQAKALLLVLYYMRQPAWTRTCVCVQGSDLSLPASGLPRAETGSSACRESHQRPAQGARRWASPANFTNSALPDTHRRTLRCTATACYTACAVLRATDTHTVTRTHTGSHTAWQTRTGLGLNRHWLAKWAAKASNCVPACLHPLRAPKTSLDNLQLICHSDWARDNQAISGHMIMIITCIYSTCMQTAK